MVTSSELATRSGGVWQNQAATVRATPNRIEHPTTVAELVAAVRNASLSGANIRPVGAGLSMTGLAAGNDVLIDLAKLRGLVGIDRQAGTATFLGGTSVDEAATILEAERLSIIGAPAIGSATLAGAMSTGAHGYAPREASFSANVAGISLVTPDGSLLKIDDRHNTQLWPAARLSLGALGVIAEVTVRIRDYVELRTNRKRRDIERLVRDLGEARAKLDFYRVDWRPHTDTAMLTVGWLEATAPAALPAASSSRRERGRRRDRIRARVARALPFLAPAIDAVANRLEPLGDEGVRAARDVHDGGEPLPFVEYQFPIAKAGNVVTALREFVHGNRAMAAADVRLTLVAADEVWLSPAYGRDVIAVMVRVPTADAAALVDLEDLFIWLGGLPSWGGFHTLTGAEAAYVMPRFSDFSSIRHDLDPYERMQNETLHRLLG